MGNPNNTFMPQNKLPSTTGFYSNIKGILVHEELHVSLESSMAYSFWMDLH